MILNGLVPTIDAENYNCSEDADVGQDGIAGKRKPKKYADRPPDVNINANLGIQLVHAIPRPPIETIDAEVVPLLSDASETGTE